MDTVAESKEKAKAALVSLFTNSLLLGLKFIGAVFTGSVGLLSEAFHSGADLVGSALVLASVRIAAAPPDEDHPYGHAKIESVAGLAEAATLTLLGLYVIIQGVLHLLHADALHNVPGGIAIAAVSALISGMAGFYIRRVGERTGSPALQANGLHLLSDLVTSTSVAVALVAVRFFGIHWMDGAIGIGLGAWLVFNALRIGWDAVQQLIDRSLPESEIAAIKSLIVEERSLISSHRLRTRLSGPVRYIDFHVVVPATWTVVEAHEVVDRLENRLRQELAPAVVVIHVDPYDAEKAKRGSAS